MSAKTDFTPAPKFTKSINPTVWQLSFFILVWTLVPLEAAPLKSVHPGYDLDNLRPSDFKPQVSGLTFDKDGNLLVLTQNAHRGMDQRVPGDLYLLKGVQSGNPSQIEVKRFAHGFFDGTGLEYINGKLYVVEKHRLIEILTMDGDITIDKDVKEVAGEYRTIHEYGWDPGSYHYHEFAFGPLYKEGYFYVALSTAPTDAGSTLKNRAALIRFPEEGGNEEIVSTGIRTPNGIGWGPEGEIFAADNQGKWLPVSKLNNIRPGRFYGFRNSVESKFLDSLLKLDTPPAAWLPHNEVSNSPTDPTYIFEGPYKNQMLMGEVFHGGINRYFLEKVKGDFQAAVFKFTGGLESAVNRMAWGPDGVLYMGMIGSEFAPFWTWQGTKQIYGLQRMKPNGKKVFDFLAARSKSSTSFELEFTEPLEAAGSQSSKYSIKSWTYKPTKVYGGSKVDVKSHNVSSAVLSADKKRVTLTVSNLQKGRVYNIKLNTLKSSGGHKRLGPLKPGIPSMNSGPA